MLFNADSLITPPPNLFLTDHSLSLCNSSPIQTWQYSNWPFSSNSSMPNYNLSD